MFKLTIKLGNAAMQSNEDVADALRETSAKLEANPRATRGTIRDRNGNTVGEWTFGGGRGSKKSRY